MRASLSKVCLSPYYTMPTQTFRYYPGYPYIKFLPKNSIIATSPNLCYCNLHCSTILCGTLLVCTHPNMFQQLIILYTIHHLKSYLTDPTYIYATILPTLRIQPTSTTKILHEICVAVGNEFVFFFFFVFFSSVRYSILPSAVWCGAATRFIDRLAATLRVCPLPLKQGNLIL